MTPPSDFIADLIGLVGFETPFSCPNSENDSDVSDERRDSTRFF